ncbi:ArsR/SmtB family transcription factor [Leucobacter albus]|uniref:ArsR/SmtB family transcription factor n=1 Tax=Leucobacter albus TaxID=272210 RepID=A0ABW3TNT6_9MICO
MLTIAARLDAMHRLGRAIADPTRSQILLALVERPGYPAELAAQLGLTRTNVSNHLACLRGCGIVVAEPEGRKTRYEIADPHLTAALLALVDVTLAVDEGAPCVDDACAVPGCCGADQTAPRSGAATRASVRARAGAGAAAPPADTVADIAAVADRR